MNASGMKLLFSTISIYLLGITTFNRKLITLLQLNKIPFLDGGKVKPATHVKAIALISLK
jgi:hypothetical protein